MLLIKILQMNVVPKLINFSELVKTSNTTLSLNIQDRLVERLNTDFTDDEQRWYVDNSYMYMNYHPTADHPINLEHVFKMIGFANKGNAMKTIKSNFTEGEDYKTVFFRMEKNPNIKNLGGRPQEKIMLNVDTFKNLCMLAKTDRGKSIRRYYVKLENVYNEFIKQEINEQKQIHLGTFSNELDAATAYNKRAEQLNKDFNCKYKINHF